jgi:hypothetical protein
MTPFVSHTPLVMPAERHIQRISIEELQKITPSGWNVRQTFEERFIFEFGETEETSWTHPDPDFDHSLYKDPPENLYPDFQPRYEALSYTWGSMENPETVFMETSLCASLENGAIPATLQVGQNLASALRHLRYSHRSRKLWIDALCINQSDDTERGEQVKRMACIYKLANRVVVWLGPEANNSKLALSTLQYLGAQVEVTRGNLSTSFSSIHRARMVSFVA